jgi:hypothetical protein
VSDSLVVLRQAGFDEDAVADREDLVGRSDRIICEPSEDHEFLGSRASQLIIRRQTKRAGRKPAA